MEVENKEIRGWVLHIIAGVQPYYASFRMIKAELEDLGFHYPDRKLKANLKYLVDKGYITLQETEHNGVKRRLNSVTPKGIDLIEKNIPEDPGVMTVG